MRTPHVNRSTKKIYSAAKIIIDKTEIFFCQTSWKDGLSKKIEMEYDLSCIIGKDYISFSRKYDLTSRRKMKDDLSQKKIHGNMIFTLNVLKRWSFQEGSRRDMIFLVLPGKVVFFFPKTWYFFPGRKTRVGRPFSWNTLKHDVFYLICSTLPCEKKIKDDPIPQKCT